MKEGYIGISKYKIFFKSVEGNFLSIFKENLDRVPPCPSTWHKYETGTQKWPKWKLFSALLLKICVLSINDILLKVTVV